MTGDVLARLFEHNDWANERMIEACAALTEEQLDATPLPDSTWSIRRTLSHIVECQQGYLALLTLPAEQRQDVSLPFEELGRSATTSGRALRTLACGDAAHGARVRTKDGYVVERWVVLVQVINHATEHRRQIGSMLRALGVKPPILDGWTYGEAVGALVPVAQA